MQLVISAFPGCGKSTVCKNAEALGLIQGHVHKDEHTGDYDISLLNGAGVPVFDSDSSVFDKANFPENYVKHIKEVLAKFPNVVIMVSSHDNVRKALAEENVPYTLVYPELELKGEYLERYEKRGSPENFVNMMDNTWNKFLDSSESDPTPNHVVLGEGEFLIDKMYDKIEDVVASAGGDKITLVDGMENMNDAPWSERIPGFSNDDNGPAPGEEITAVIVDVNADANNPDTIQPEPTGGIEVGVVSVPESVSAATLEGGDFEGTQPAVDASTVDDSALGEDRLDLVEAKIDIREDIDTLEQVLVHCSEPDRGGLESLEDNGSVFQAASADIKKRYGVDVEPTLAGMEGFLDSLKGAIGKITEKLKKQPSKAELAVIVKYLFEADKAAKLYSEASWQEGQQFKNVGKAKFSIPSSMTTATNPDSVKTTLNGFLTIIDKEHTTYLSNAKQRMTAGLKVFNKFKNKSVPDDDWGPVIEEVKKLLPLKPDKKESPAKGVFDAVLNTSMVSGEIPVLKKDDVKGIVDILQDLNKRAKKYEEDILDLAMDGVSYDDIYDSEFWDAADDDVLRGMTAGAEWENATTSLNTLQEIYTKNMFVIAKFLEQWILNSVK